MTRVAAANGYGEHDTKTVLD